MNISYPIRLNYLADLIPTTLSRLRKAALLPENFTIYTVPNARLNSLRKSIIYQGPLAYNYFCNKIQNSLNSHKQKYKYEIHKLSPKCFLSHIKRQLFLEQATGLPNTWESPNTPMYSIPTSTVTLRTQSRSVSYAEGD